MSEPRLRLHVDRVACVAHGLCADWLPEAVELDEWGYPVLTLGSGAELPPALLEDARRAARACPVRALRLVRAGSGP